MESPGIVLHSKLSAGEGADPPSGVLCKVQGAWHWAMATDSL